MSTSTGEVWHYTDSGGLQGILGSSSFWASSFKAMNDPGEIGYGLGIFTEAWKSMEAKQPPEVVKYVRELLNPESLLARFDYVHLLSAARDGDSLSHWRAYAGTNGVSLGLDAQTVLRSDPRALLLQGTRPDIWGVSWLKVVYRRKIQLARSEHFLNYVIEEAASASRNPDRAKAHQLQTIWHIASFKHPGFADERELRSTLTIGGAQPPVRRRGETRVPYVPFICLGPENEVQKLPLTAVRYGPTATSDDIATYRQFMDESGYENTPLITSSVPFR